MLRAAGCARASSEMSKEVANALLQKSAHMVAYKQVTLTTTGRQINQPFVFNFESSSVLSHS